MRRGSLERFPKGFFSFLSSVKYDCGLWIIASKQDVLYVPCNLLVQQQKTFISIYLLNFKLFNVVNEIQCQLLREWVGRLLKIRPQTASLPI